MITVKSITKDTVLDSVKRRGPSIPLDLFKELGGDTLLMGAYLSELYQSGVLKISNVKIGGSPLYFFEDQKDQLQNFSKYLNEKDRRTYNLLKEKKVLKDSTQTPLIQISLRNIKDFAMPLIVKLNGTEEQFFKWYLASNEEATEEIRKILTANNVNTTNDENNTNNTSDTNYETLKKEEKISDKKEIKSKNLVQDSEINNINNNQDSTNPDEDSIKKNDNISNNKKYSEKHIKNEKNSILDDYSDNIKSVFDGKKLHKSSQDDIFTESLFVFFESRNIIIKKQTIDKKGKENSYELEIPSEVGIVSFICKAIKKAKVSDSDLSKCYVQMHSVKLPMLFLYDGELSKKATDLSKTFINFIIKKLE